MVGLLDVNVLIALAWPNHHHHRVALDWFRENQKAGWATCPLTQSGFVRVSSNHKAIPEAKSPHEAILLLRHIVALPHHQFWTDDVAFATSEYIAPEKLLGYRQTTDAHLLALALRHGGQLVTLDHGIRSLVPREYSAQEVVVLVVEREAR
jgi:toxin-antitoxin system PIN domain toxin